MKAQAPGKLILSGEHAVVYGMPALAMAVNRYVTATVTRETRPQIAFDLSDLAHHSHISLQALRDLKSRVKQKYHRFIRGDYSIREVLQKPFELAQFTLGVIADALNVSLSDGVKIHVESTIPIGCGMGSSAATILSVMHAMSTYLQAAVPNETLFKLALEAENAQHGHSSGLDLRVALEGGCLYVYGDKIEQRTVTQIPMYLVNTGTPQSTTGQCVEKVAVHFSSITLQHEFASVTNDMDAALKSQSRVDVQRAIKRNHQLLTQIGVVPNTIQEFISHIEQQGGAAKTCGAGSISGEKGGAVLVITEDENTFIPLCQRFGYHVIPIAGESRGVHAI